MFVLWKIFKLSTQILWGDFRSNCSAHQSCTRSPVRYIYHSTAFFTVLYYFNSPIPTTEECKADDKELKLCEAELGEWRLPKWNCWLQGNLKTTQK